MVGVILVQPKTSFKEFFHSAPMLPLGLLSISRYLVKKYKVKVIDQRIDHNWKETLIKKLNKTPLCEGLTSLNGGQIKYALEASQLFKNYNPNGSVL